MLWDAFSNKNDFYIFNFTVCVCVIRICEKLCLKWQKKEKKKDNPLEDFSVSVD